MDTIFDMFSNDRKIYPKKFSPHVSAWQINDVNEILEWLRTKEQVVLGGDLLNPQGGYTYDSWYYNYKDEKSLHHNINESVDVAKKYILDYISNNGDDYYVVIVLK